MAADLVPIRLGLPDGDLYTLWAPRWVEGGDEWEGFLGLDEDLYAFKEVAELVAFVRSGAENDLSDHPAWAALTEANAHRFTPADEYRFDLVAVEDLLAEKPTDEALQGLSGAMAVASSIGSVCELPKVTRFFNGNPTLSAVNNGVEEFAGKAGLKRWKNIAAIVGRNWDSVLESVTEIITTPDVDEKLVKTATAELDEPAPEIEEEELPAVADPLGADSDDDSDDDSEDAGADEDATLTAVAVDRVLGADKDFWLEVGIDPIQILSGAGSFFTLRCYFDERPIFLGRNGRISVFGSERSLARYLADEHDHDLSDLSTYDDIRTAATDGSLDVEVTDDNVYVLTGLADDIADGPEAVDRDQLELVVELLRDIGDYSEEDTVDKALAADAPLGKFVGYLLDGSGKKPAAPHANAVKAFEDLERFVESRLRRE